MNLARFVFRSVNKALAVSGFRLDRQLRDFDDAPLDRATLEAVFRALTLAFDEWLQDQRLFQPTVTFDTFQIVHDFYGRWRDAPFRERQGGSRFNNMLWLHLIAKAYEPEFIVDSGTYQGASAWALSLACPQARTLSFDIDLSPLRLKAPNVDYIQSDWSVYPFPNSAPDRVLCYFDDHVDQVKRLLQATERGCQLAIFDDDYPVTSYYAMAPSPAVLPKLEFALDPSMVDGRVLEWTFAGRQHRWVADRTYLDAALAAIRATERLPNTSLITGIHQTPYRLVAVGPRR
jgi:hypothetical protein